MVDSVSKEKRSEIMRHIKSENTIFEDAFRKTIWNKGLRYRKNVKSMMGKPDIFFPKNKIVIFLDSCFWHGCPYHCRMPKSNVEYWGKKIARNKERDKKVKKYYKDKGFTIIRFWEHKINKEFDKSVDFVESLVNDKIKK